MFCNKVLQTVIELLLVGVFPWQKHTVRKGYIYFFSKKKIRLVVSIEFNWLSPPTGDGLIDYSCGVTNLDGGGLI